MPNGVFDIELHGGHALKHVDLDYFAEIFLLDSIRVVLLVRKDHEWDVSSSKQGVLCHLQEDLLYYA